jgi:hypothetical protein
MRGAFHLREREEAAALPTSWWERCPKTKDDKEALPWQEVPDSNCERRNATVSNALRPQSEPPATASKTAGTGQKRAFLRVAGGILPSWAWITIIAITVSWGGFSRLGIPVGVLGMWTCPRMQFKLPSAKLPAASSEYSGSSSRRARGNCLGKQRNIHDKQFLNNEKRRRMLPQEPTALSLARRGSASVWDYPTRRLDLAKVSKATARTIMMPIMIC